LDVQVSYNPYSNVDWGAEEGYYQFHAHCRKLDAGEVERLYEATGHRGLVVGDVGELGEQAEALQRAAGEQARALGIERLYAFGELSRAAVAGFGAGGRHFESLDTLIDTLRDELGNGVAVLVKGSRSARMERVIEALSRETA
jgi:UDP-N-acetylmuramoyl-tripeptide--D-alanyl-D-alanine ligase